MANFLYLFTFVLSLTATAGKNPLLQTLGEHHARILATPPIPMLTLKKDVYAGGARYNSLSSILDTSRTSLELDSVSLGGSVLYQKTEKLGFFLSLQGAASSGEGEMFNTANNLVTTEMSEASMLETSLGVSYSFWRTSIMPIQVVIAPSLLQESASLEFNEEKFDFSRSQTYLKFGIQAGLKVASWMRIIPYYFQSNSLTDLDNCESVSGLSNYYAESSDCDDDLYYSTDFVNYGLNLYFPSIYLVVGLSRQFSSPTEVDQLESNELSLRLIFL